MIESSREVSLSERALEVYQNWRADPNALRVLLDLFRSPNSHSKKALLLAVSIYYERQQWSSAIALLEEAEHIFPGDKSRWHVMISELHAKAGNLPESLLITEGVIKADPENEQAYINRARWHALIHGDCIQTKILFEAWASKFTDHLVPLQRFVENRSLEKNKILNIGYMSGDLKNHAIRYFIEAYFRFRSATDYRVHVFMTMPGDTISENLRLLVDDWHDVSTISDQSICEKIRELEIDILVDLSGHTEGNRLKVFARRAAPVQVTWLGFLPTLGMRTIDWRISDHGVTPAGTENFYTERLFRLRCMATYTPPVGCERMYPAPYKTNRYVTIACLNHSRKISNEALKIWAQVLRQSPEVGLLLISDSESEEAKDTELSDRTNKLGLPSEQVTIVPRLTMRAFMNLASVIDFAVDSFPVSGGTTTLHALWMGLPTITIDNNAHSGEHGSAAATLRGCGLDEWITPNLTAYENKIIEFAANTQLIDNARAKARSALQQSPLMAYSARVRELEDAYRFMWSDFIQRHTERSESHSTSNKDFGEVNFREIN